MHKLISLMEECNLKKNNIDLSSEEQEIFMKFICDFSKLNNRHIIYRGESNLQKHYNTDLTNVKLLADLIFMVGQKGRNYISDKEKFTTNGISDYEFNEIFMKFHDKVCNLRFNSPSTKTVMSRFLENNPKFRDFFKDIRNKNIFISNFEKCSEEDKLLIKDYYVAILHSIGKSGFNNSFMISSSTSKKIALNFQGQENGILLCGWVPILDYSTQLVPSFINDRKFLEQKGFPIATEPVYPEQKEILIKGGILSHYLLGFKDNKGNFHINPALFSTIEQGRSIKDIINKGFIIDQSDFNEKLEQTNYKKSFIYKRGHIIDQS